MARLYDSQWQQVRLVVLARDGHQCQVRLPRCRGVASQVDHIVPLSEGGERLDPRNLRASCGYCNAARNASRVAELAAALDRGPGVGPSREW